MKDHFKVNLAASVVCATPCNAGSPRNIGQDLPASAPRDAVRHPQPSARSNPLVKKELVVFMPPNMRAEVGFDKRGIDF